MRWVVRVILVFTALSILGVRALRHPVHYGYNAKPVTHECDPGLRGHEAERDLVLHVASNGRAKVNHEVVEFTELRGRLAEIYKTRAEHVLFLDVSDDVAFGTVAEFLSEATSTATDVRFIIVTPATRSACREKWAAIQGAA